MDFLNIDTSGSIYTFAQLFSNTAYTFLPILIAYSGAKSVLVQTRIWVQLSV